MQQNTTGKDEQIKLSFLGLFKYEGSNPSNKTIIILALALIFFVVAVVFLSPHLAAIKSSLPDTAKQVHTELLQVTAGLRGASG